MVPMASENQKTSFCPSTKKGINPKQVERMVSKIGIALPATDLIKFRLYEPLGRLLRSLNKIYADHMAK
jgi:hypothetical protein